MHYWPTRDTESTGVTLESNSEPLEAIVAATQLPSISEPVNSNLSVATGPRLAGEAVTANQIGPSRQVLMEWMVDWLAQALKLPTTAIDVQRPLAEYGLDSLNAVELAAALQSSLGVPLSPTLAYEYPTIEALSTYLMATQEQATGSLLESLAEFPRDDQVEQLVDQLAQLSGAEIQALLGTPSIQWN